MSRPNKRKRVCKMPMCIEFEPKSNEFLKNTIELAVEEYETVRLIDYLGKSQEECARQMNVARATVQTLYTDARKKIARFLVEGTNLQISGGNYQICENSKQNRKGNNSMKIAVTYKEEEVFQHFGQSEQFKLYEVENDKITSSEIIDTNGNGHGALATFLKEKGIDILICGGIGGGARSALAEADIKLFPGAKGNADLQVESFLKGNLIYDPDTACAHHGESHEHKADCSSGKGSCGGHN